MRFFGLKSCETCRKALVQLRAAGHDPQVIDVRADRIAPADLAMILQTFGSAAINRASTTWRSLTAVEQGAEPAQLLASYPALLKRPVIDHDGRWTQGWTTAVQVAVLAV